MITLEVQMDDVLFHQLQGLLDSDPTCSLDILFAEAVRLYLLAHPPHSGAVVPSEEEYALSPSR
jgi:hypothetical protein